MKIMFRGSVPLLLAGLFACAGDPVGPHRGLVGEYDITTSLTGYFASGPCPPPDQLSLCGSVGSAQQSSFSAVLRIVNREVLSAHSVFISMTADATETDCPPTSDSCAQTGSAPRRYPLSPSPVGPATAVVDSAGHFAVTMISQAGAAQSKIVFNGRFADSGDNFLGDFFWYPRNGTSFYGGTFNATRRK